MPLNENWSKIFTPIIQHLMLQIRFDVRNTRVEIKTYERTKNIANLQKAANFVEALVLFRTDDHFVESFKIKDVKTPKGEDQSRAIGRIAGKGGMTKITLENATNTRLVIKDSKIHILGTYEDFAMVRRAICSLIMGYPAVDRRIVVYFRE